LACVLRRP